MIKIAFTGHRPESFSILSKEESLFNDKLKKLLEKFIDDFYFIVGGCRGVDSWAAKYAINNKIDFDLYLPFPFEIYSLKWNDEDKYFLKKQIELAKNVKICSKEYNSKYYIIRDRDMVDNCDILVSWFLHNKKRSGTAATINYAKKISKSSYYLRDMEV